ncbi:MlaD family protein [Conexibacter sp. JD483]|uniref:MlaD family protein n=1 Tax=unclassified Conexibacter TaxID=2627773 RepID=UPI002723EC0D|nr:MULTISPECIES: MlaD family protein [unclassified Conexibacter]MDO8186155.1 MlaD family protein [Conexibacter sp. CPCC 205706]MDO8199645.1 MlaD family protein [Conexibacter sp. CPCC 205762]MDR9369101.1 MlaD family protein [Conexibacter sp. JD483]
MTTAIRKHLRDFLAILGLVIVAAIVGGYILANQRISFPTWVPIVGREEFILKGEFSTAQAVTPGQGQTVDIAGVQVGEISNVELKDGRALVTMRIDPRYDDIYTNATMLLRPKTGLKDMIVELDPGTRGDGAERVRDGYTLPVSQTRPDVNLDEILSVLDADTRTYLQLLLNTASVGLTGNGQELAQVFRRFDPLARDARRATELLRTRDRHIRRAVTNFGRLTEALSQDDRKLATFVDSSQAVLRRFADQGDNIEQTLQLLPSTLQTTRTALESTRRFADAAGPALESLRPFARELGPALRATRPFLTETTPIIEEQIRPFTVAATPVVKQLRPAAQKLAAASPDLVTTFSILNEFLNALTYRQNGREGYLFYLTWLGHLANSALSTQDANGALLRSALLVNCGNLTGIGALKGSANPAQAALTLTSQLSGLPDVQVDPTDPLGRRLLADNAPLCRLIR